MGRVPLATLVLLYVVAALVRVAYVAQTRGAPLTRDRARGTDMEVFDRIAREVVGGKWLAGSASDSPLYPCVFLPAMYWITGGDVHRAAAAQGAFAALLAVLAFAIARRVFSDAAGAIAGFLIAFYAPLIVYDTEMLGEVVLNVLAAASVWALLRAGSRATWGRCAIAGAFIGLAAAAKPTTLPFSAVGVAWLAWGLRVRPKRMAAALAVVLAAALAVMAPFVVRTKLLSGRFFAVRGNSGIIFLMDNNPTATGAFTYPRGRLGERYRQATEGKDLAERDRIAYDMAWEFIRTQPGRAARLTLRKLALFLSAPEIGNNLSVRRQKQVSFVGLPVFIGYGLLLPLACVGWFAGRCRGRGRFLLTAYVVLHAGVIVAFIVLARYRLVVVPVLAVFAARGLTHLGSCLAHRRWRNFAIGLLALLCVAAFVNRRALVRAADRVAHPHGWRVQEGSTVQIRDGVPGGAPFGVTLTSPDVRIRKTLMIPQADYPRLHDPKLVLEAQIQPGTLWTVSANGTALAGPSTPPRDAPNTLVVPLRADMLKPGPNRFDVSVSKGSLRVRLDDRYDFDRSALSRMGRWRTDLLDMQTAARRRSLWFGSGEWRIWLTYQVR